MPAAKPVYVCGPGTVTVDPPFKVYVYGLVPAVGVIVIEPVLAPQVVATVEKVAGNPNILLNVTVSELTSGTAVHELNVVLITYWVEGTAGGQTFGKVISKIPGVVVAVSALAMKVPLSVNNCALTKFDVPPFGVKRYPVFDSLHCVQFLPGAARAFNLVSS